jgi:hypothetical protein
VWTAARDAIADGTDQDDWTAFLTTGAQVAAERDLREAIEEADAEQAAKLRAEQLATAKRLAAAAAAAPGHRGAGQRHPTGSMCCTCTPTAKGTEVKLASQVALNAPDAELDQALSTFIFTGGAAANKKDEDAAAAKELAGYRTTATAIRDEAKADGYQPNLLAAANQGAGRTTPCSPCRPSCSRAREDARKLDEAFRAKATRDFDGDAKPDVVTVATTGELYLYRGKGQRDVPGWPDHDGHRLGPPGTSAQPGDFRRRRFRRCHHPDARASCSCYRGDGKGGFLNGDQDR